MDLGIGKIIKDGNGNAIIFTALAAAALANTIPTPFDAIYFRRQQILKQQLENGEISIESYWWHDIGEYYCWTSAWYASLFGILYAMNNSSKTNVKILTGLLGVGVVVGVGYLNIRKDKEIAELKKTLVIKKPSDLTNIIGTK
jgi:hypothetical protein